MILANYRDQFLYPNLRTFAQMSQAKIWSYTLNNPTLLEKESIKGIYELHPECIAFHVVQLEAGLAVPADFSR